MAVLTSTLVLAALVSRPSRAYAVDPVTPVALGTAGTYSALGRTNVVNSLGPTTLSGDVGVTAGDSLVDGTIAGFGSDMATVGGATHVNDAAAIQAQADLLIAYDDARGRPPTGSFAGDQNREDLHLRRLLHRRSFRTNRDLDVGQEKTTPILSSSSRLTLR